MSTEDFRRPEDEEAAESGRAADEAVTERDRGSYDPAAAAAAEGLTATQEQGIPPAS